MNSPLRLREVGFTYRRAPAPALRGVDLTLAEGEFLAVAGRTGAGKTTCLRTFNGLIPFTLKGEMSGSVELYGAPLDRARRAEAVRRIGMVFQDFEAQLFSTTLRGEVAFGLERRGLPRAAMNARVDEALERVGLSALADREPGQLSGGQKQRLAIACLLAARPDVLALDEPTTDLDPVGKAEVGALLQELSAAGRATVLVEHETELLARSHRALFVEDGRIAAAERLVEFADDPEGLASFGVRPPDLARLWKLLGLSAPPDSLDDAAQRLQELRFVADPTRLPAAPALGDPLFTLEGAGFAYPGGAPVFAGLELTIRRGESVALLGANGAGKTTLVGLLNGLRRASSGRVIFAGQDVAAMTVGELGRRIGYVFQNPDWQIFAANVFDEVAFTLQMRGVPASERPARVTRVLEQVGLAGAEARDPFMMTKGERQKLALAAVLVGAPDVLILDEPTTGLDALEQAAMNRFLRGLLDAGCTLIVVTHSMHTALELCARTVLLGPGGILADGPTRTVFAAPELLAKAQLRAPLAAQLAARLGLGALDVHALAACLRRPA